MNIVLLLLFYSVFCIFIQSIHRLVIGNGQTTFIHRFYFLFCFEKMDFLLFRLPNDGRCEVQGYNERNEEYKGEYIASHFNIKPKEQMSDKMTPQNMKANVFIDEPIKDAKSRPNTLSTHRLKANALTAEPFKDAKSRPNTLSTHSLKANALTDEPIKNAKSRPNTSSTHSLKANVFNAEPFKFVMRWSERMIL